MPRTDLKGVTDIGTVTAEDIDSIGNTQGKVFSEDVKTSQLRNFYSAVSGIRVQYQREKTFTPKIERSLILLKPKLAYATGRNPKQLKGFQQFIVQAIDGVVKSGNKNQAMDNFFDLLEAVVAYHKFHGGKDK
jgi:CRISPR-associated protein Csm2